MCVTQARIPIANRHQGFLALMIKSCMMKLNRGVAFYCVTFLKCCLRCHGWTATAIRQGDQGHHGQRAISKHRDASFSWLRSQTAFVFFSAAYAPLFVLRQQPLLL